MTTIAKKKEIERKKRIRIFHCKNKKKTFKLNYFKLVQIDYLAFMMQIQFEIQLK